MTSYLSENEAKNLQNGDDHLAQIADFGSTEVNDGSFFAYFTLFHLNLTFFDQSFPLK